MAKHYSPISYRLLWWICTYTCPRHWHLSRSSDIGCLFRGCCFQPSLVDWLIDWGLTPLSTIFSHIPVASSPLHVFPGCLTPVIHTTIFPSNWLLSHIGCKPIGGRRMTLVTVTCQTTERMLAELGFKLTTPGLTARVATDWATGAQHNFC